MCIIYKTKGLLSVSSCIMYLNFIFPNGLQQVALAEWLRRVPAKYMGFPRESSNLSGDGIVFFYLTLLCYLTRPKYFGSKISVFFPIREFLLPLCFLKTFYILFMSLMLENFTQSRMDIIILICIIYFIFIFSFLNFG